MPTYQDITTEQLTQVQLPVASKIQLNALGLLKKPFCAKKSNAPMEPGPIWFGMPFLPVSGKTVLPESVCSAVSL
jgi:hypothetical protein